METGCPVVDPPFHEGIQHLKEQGPKQSDLIFECLLLPLLASQIARLVRWSKHSPLE